MAAAGLICRTHPRPAPPPAQSVLGRIAVLPFDTLDRASLRAGFGKAVAEQIITTLDDVQVPTVSREDTASIGGADRDAAALKNGAEFILSGSVQKRRQGLTRYRASRSCSDLYATVWTRSYDQATAQPLEFQAQIAASASDVVRSALKVRKEDPAELNDSIWGWSSNCPEGIRHRHRGEFAAATARLSRQLIAQAPNLYYGYSVLAVVSALLIDFTLAQTVLPSCVPMQKIWRPGPWRSIRKPRTLIWLWHC